ncbi:aay [Bugula neritina]|uniref:Phosphoserine phosphatase n=1 Tax=Bugula neritina TaxID=10212 RepID=A0A7J7JB39_BUGNE|nr:aay [Bugula neritina]
MEKVKEVWRQCDAVCFDVDSTVITGEGLDELASYMNKGEEIAALTRKAMGGTMTFREALEMRLNILQPNKSDLQGFIQKNSLQFTEGLRCVFGVWGFISIIQPIADQLNIPTSSIYANHLKFNEDGSYAGFDVDQPTSASGGKPKVAQILKETKGYKHLVFIGDGATDAEASPPADAFIGFGGNVVRDSVKQASSWYVYNFQELIAELS